MTPSELHFRTAGLAGGGVVRALFSTVRFRAENEEAFLHPRREGRAVIFVFWHGVLLPLAFRHRGQGVTVLVSEHADGEYITRIIHGLGFRTARGSSTRGGAAGLRGLVRAARAGGDLAITADGPRGPRHVIKGGALTAAKITGLPLVPVAALPSRAWVLDSWDRFVIPKPFSTIRVAYGDPLFIPRGSGPEELEAAGARLHDTLAGLLPPFPAETA